MEGISLEFHCYFKALNNNATPTPKIEASTLLHVHISADSESDVLLMASKYIQNNFISSLNWNRAPLTYELPL